MLQPTIRSQFSEKGRQWYYQLKPELEKKYHPDDVVLIETESGNYFIGKTTIEAYKSARRKYPKKKFFGAHVGQLASALK